MNGIFKRALLNRQKVTVMYMDENNRITMRDVKVFKMNDEYLFVYCYYRKKIRMLKMENILSAEVVKERIGA